VLAPPLFNAFPNEEWRRDDCEEWCSGDDSATCDNKTFNSAISGLFLCLTSFWVDVDADELVG
jgi:hypothetical protein